MIIEGVGKSLNTPPRMGLKRGGIKGLVGVGREDIEGVYIPSKKYRRCGNGRVAAAF